MDLLERIRKYEHLHIVFWLLKDSCWMLELKLLGTIIMVPTLYVAVFIMYKTRHLKDFHINAAIFFWILANSFWMMMEFFNDNNYKHYAGIPFGIGFIFVGIFYFKSDNSQQKH